MTSSPRTNALPSRPASAPGRDFSSRSRASTSAGPAPGSRISSTTHSPDTATRPPSVSTASTGTSMPVLPSRRHRLRAATRSVRASTSTASCGPASSSAATSGAAVRTPCGSSVNAGRTDPGSGSAVSRRSSTWCLLVSRALSRAAPVAAHQRGPGAGSAPLSGHGGPRWHRSRPRDRPETPARGSLQRNRVAAAARLRAARAATSAARRSGAGRRRRSPAALPSGRHPACCRAAGSEVG